MSTGFLGIIGRRQTLLVGFPSLGLCQAANWLVPVPGGRTLKGVVLANVARGSNGFGCSIGAGGCGREWRPLGVKFADGDRGWDSEGAAVCVC